MRHLRVATLIASVTGVFSNCAMAEQTDARAAYQEAFLQQTRVMMQQVLSASPEMAGADAEAIADRAEQLARALSKCHMEAMNFYAPELQQVAFSTIANGGTYADAKMAFESALAAEGAAGGERQEALAQMYEAAMQAGNECYVKVKETE